MSEVLHYDEQGAKQFQAETAARRHCCAEYIEKDQTIASLACRSVDRFLPTKVAYVEEPYGLPF